MAEQYYDISAKIFPSGEIIQIKVGMEEEKAREFVKRLKLGEWPEGKVLDKALEKQVVKGEVTLEKSAEFIGMMLEGLFVKILHSAVQVQIKFMPACFGNIIP